MRFSTYSTLLRTTPSLILIFEIRCMLQQTGRSITSLLRSQTKLCHHPMTIQHSSISNGSFDDRLVISRKDSKMLRLQHLGTSSGYSEVLPDIACHPKYTVATMILSTDAKWPKRIGLRAGCVYCWNFYGSTYSIQVVLKFPRIFGQRILAVEATVRTSTLSWSLSRFYGSRDTPMVVDCRSPLMRACSEGNLRAARDLIESRKANLSDRRGRCCCKNWDCRSHEGETALFVSSLILFNF